MVKIGIVDFDTSHVVAFTQRINHVGVDSDQWVNGAKVTVGCPGKSLLSPERIPGFTQQMQEYGVPLVDTPEEIIGQVDAVMIESVDGSVHYDRNCEVEFRTRSRKRIRQRRSGKSRDRIGRSMG